MELKLSEEQMNSLLNVEDWDTGKCLDIIIRCSKRIQGIKDVKEINEHLDDVPELENTLAKTPQRSVIPSTRKTNKMWCKDDREFLKQKFIQYKGNITEKRFDNLIKSLKRSFGSIKTQISLNRETWLKEIGKIIVKMDTTLPEQKPKPSKKRKKYKKSAKTEKLYDKARELMKADKQPKQNFGHYIGQAKKLIEGDAHTQQPQQTEPEKQSEVPFPRIYPLSQVGNYAFINVCKDLVFNPAKRFKYSDAIATLNLANDLEWTISLWEQFIDQIRYSSDALCNYFDVSGSFGMERSGSTSIIKYKRG